MNIPKQSNPLLALLTGFFALCLTWQSAQAQTYSTQLLPPLIEVTGEGTAYAQPNEAELSISFTDTNFKLHLARETVDDQVKSLLKVLGRFELDTSSLDTSRVSIQPRYDYRQNNQRNFIGYQVNRTVSFTLTNLEQLDKLVKAISEENISRLDSIRFTHSNPEKLKQEALDNAIENSKELAEHIAASYGTQIDRIYRVNYLTPSVPQNTRMMAMSAEMAMDSGANYSQKDLEFKVTVQASFKLK